MIRSFLAIELPKVVQEKLEEAQTDLRSSRSDVRWVGAEKIHLTLKFFGNIDDSRIEAIVTSIQDTLRRTRPFSAKIHGIGAFPHLKNPRVIWTGLVEEKGILIPFQKGLEMELEKIGFEPEGKPFQPHLTLGRVKSAKGREALIAKLERYREEEFGEFEVQGVVLFRSDLRPTGPIYTPLKRLILGGH